MFDTRIVIVVRDDLAVWQKLNVTAFLVSGLIGRDASLIGDAYEDAAGNRYNALAIQPMMVLSAAGELLRTIRRRAVERAVPVSLYIDEMFSTGHDAANRAAMKASHPDTMMIAGLALREERKVVDKITKGARMHG